MAQVIVSTQAASFATISHADTGYASSLFNSQRQLGSALGRVAGHHRAGRRGHHPSWSAGTGGQPGRLPRRLPGCRRRWPWSDRRVALTINDADAAATMVLPSGARPTRGSQEHAYAGRAAPADPRRRAADGRRRPVRAAPVRRG